MNMEAMEAAGIHYAAGLQRFSGRADLYEKFLKRFGEDENFSQLEKAVAAGETQEAFRYAHALKGVSGNLSLDRFYSTLVLLVEKLRVGEADGTQELMQKLCTEYDSIVCAVAQE